MFTFCKGFYNGQGILYVLRYPEMVTMRIRIISLYIFDEFSEFFLIYNILIL